MKSYKFKKRISSIISLILVFGASHSSALTNTAITGFTHPEIGEFIIYGLENDMPFFSIYGFTQYKILNPDEPYRNIPAHSKNEKIELYDTLKKLLDDVQNIESEYAPLLFEYTGLLQDYTAKLNVLPKKEKIKAISLIAGFEGKNNLIKLFDIDGFQDIDLEYLEESYTEYTIELEGITYPYRVLMFYIEEENWEESYFERYSFIKQGSQWNLLHIAKEYAGEYSNRNKYIHGLAGMSLEMYESVDHDFFRGHNWFSTQGNISTIENVPSIDNSINIDNIKVFRLPSDTKFTYEKDWLSSIEYQFHMEQSYYSAFISLYMRYYDPVTLLPNGNMSWSLPDMTIELIYDNERPILRILPRIDFEKLSAG